MGRNGGPSPARPAAARLPPLPQEPGMHRNVILAALSVSLLGVSAPAQAQQDQWTRQITRLLDQAASVATERGLHRTHNPLIGSLRTGASTAHTIQLDGGVAYQLVGVCDNDCSDFDLRL